MKKLLQFCLLIFVVSTALLLISHCVMEINSVQTVSQVIVQHSWVFTLCRYGLYAIVLICWPYFIEFIGIRQKWSPETVIYLSHQRLKLFGLLAFIEIFFVDNLLGHLFMWL